VLRDILGRVPTSHRALDRATHRRDGTTPETTNRAGKSSAASEVVTPEQHDDHPIEELRTALVVAGLVPPQRPTLDRYHRRVDELIASVPEQVRLVVRRYLRWAVTRLLQQTVDAGATVSPQLVDWPLERARVACQFTTAVATNGGRLTDIRQSQLDAWIAELPSHRPVLRAFVRWAVGHDYMPAGLDVLAASSRELRAAMDDDERLGLARHLLRDRTDDPPARLAAVLVLLFGQRVTRLTALDVDAVSVDDDGRVALALSDTPVRLREPLAALALQVADAARGRGSPWLFPSSQGHRPLSPQAVARPNWPSRAETRPGGAQRRARIAGTTRAAR
jgi:integrase